MGFVRFHVILAGFSLIVGWEKKHLRFAPSRHIGNQMRGWFIQKRGRPEGEAGGTGHGQREIVED